MPAEPFWGLLILLYGVLAIVAGIDAALLVAALSIGLAGALHVAIRLASTRRRRRDPALRAASLRM